MGPSRPNVIHALYGLMTTIVHVYASTPAAWTPWAVVVVAVSATSFTTTSAFTIWAYLQLRAIRG